MIYFKLNLKRFILKRAAQRSSVSWAVIFIAFKHNFVQINTNWFWTILKWSSVNYSRIQYPVQTSTWRKKELRSHYKLHLLSSLLRLEFGNWNSAFKNGRRVCSNMALLLQKLSANFEFIWNSTSTFDEIWTQDSVYWRAVSFLNNLVTFILFYESRSRLAKSFSSQKLCFHKKLKFWITWIFKRVKGIHLYTYLQSLINSKNIKT